MSKVFKRPMFRGGGNVNTGILSGIRDNFSNGTPSERIAKAREEFSKPAFDPVAQLLIQGGLSGFSQTGGGSTAANLAKAFEGPTAQFFSNLSTQQQSDEEMAVEGVLADINQEIEDEKLKVKNLEIQQKAAQADDKLKSKIDVEIQKGKNKIAELQFKKDNPDLSVGQQVTPAFENVVDSLTSTYQDSKNPAVKSVPNQTAFNVTKFRREASPEIQSKYKGFKPYTRDNKGNVVEVPYQGKPGEIVYDPISQEFLVFDNTGSTFNLNRLTFEIEEK
tara:strand:+ start:152 stop:982 length:831 start_codon:yes stop_codon:yes gene_type:complete